MRTLSFEESIQVSGGVVQTNDDLGSGFGMPGASSIMDPAYLLGAGCTIEMTGNSMTVTCPAGGGNSGATYGGSSKGKGGQIAMVIAGAWTTTVVAGAVGFTVIGPPGALAGAAAGFTLGVLIGTGVILSQPANSGPR